MPMLLTRRGGEAALDSRPHVRMTRGALAGLAGVIVRETYDGRCVLEVACLASGVHLVVSPGWLEDTDEYDRFST
jgi:hypothetical protein